MHVSESEFRVALELALDDLDTSSVQAVTGPGRSGAITAVYASHYLGVPFIPYGQRTPLTVMVVDTNSSTGKTLRKAKRGQRFV